jgi:hypothetical protein
MKRKMWWLTLMLALLCGQAAWAQDMYVVAVGGVGTKINTVPYTISAPGFYYLGGNLTNTGNTSAITITADDVTLDLMGFKLTGGGGTAGILINGRSNVEVRNGTVRGFSSGITEQVATGNKHRIINVRSINNSVVGINLNGDSHLVKGCDCSNNGAGITLSAGIITNCIINNNTNSGVFVLNSGIIADCIATGNNLGITLDGTGSVLGNIASGNTTNNYLFRPSGAERILVDRNTASGLATNYASTAPTTNVLLTANNAGQP